MIRLSILSKIFPIDFCSAILGTNMSISDICFPETSTNVEPAPTVSAYFFNSLECEKIKYESSIFLIGIIDWNP